MRISPRRQAQIRNDNLLRKQRTEMCQGLCESCGRAPDWRGLSLSHTKHKGMGGTSHLYTIDEVTMACGKCHAEKGHHEREG